MRRRLTRLEKGAYLLAVGDFNELVEQEFIALVNESRPLYRDKSLNYH